jgi:hypothetical protein
VPFVALVLGTVALVGGAALLACLLRLRSAVSFVLAVYLIAWGEIVLVAFGLSAGRWLERWTLLAAFGVLCAIAAVVWLLRGRPTPPSLSAAARSLLPAARDPLVAAPLVISTGALLYTLIVSLSTAPNDGDPLAYELTRAAFWRQEHGIVNLEAAYYPLDYWPPVMETGLLVVLTLSGTEQLAGLVQWFAVPILALATFGVGRRIGLDRAAALWGAALVPLFPVVLAQSWSAFTDLVFGSFAVAAVYFGIGALGVELVPFGLAVGLAVGTKFLGPILAPLFALILAFAQPVRRWPYIAGAALAGAGIASFWYLRTQLEAGDPVGNSGGGIQSREVAPVVTTFARLSGEIFDLSGAHGRDIWVYAIAAGALAAVGVARWASSRREGTVILAAAALIALTPHLVTAVGKGYAEVGVALGEALGRGDLVNELRDWSPSRISDGAYSWFGPVGAVLAVGAVPIAIAENRRGRVGRAAIALAAAPIVAIGLISITIAYQSFQGRYFIAAFALCSAVWGGFALAHRWVGAAIVGLAAVTVLLTFVNSLGKPSGIGLLRGDPGRSVWSLPRWEQQGILRSTPQERDEVMTMRLVEERVRDDAALGVALAFNSFVFPYFGRDLERKLRIVDEGDVLPADIDWVVASPGRALLGCPAAWSRERLGPYGWSAWRRTSPDTCSDPRLLVAG